MAMGYATHVGEAVEVVRGLKVHRANAVIEIGWLGHYDDGVIAPIDYFANEFAGRDVFEGMYLRRWYSVRVRCSHSKFPL